MANSELNYVPAPGVAGKFISVCEDESGALQGIEFHDDDNFNFGFDVVDVLAAKCPDKTAMLHVSKEGKERRITFKDMMTYSATQKTTRLFLKR